jgi:hypothetical protein
MVSQRCCATCCHTQLLMRLLRCCVCCAAAAHLPVSQALQAAWLHCIKVIVAVTRSFLHAVSAVCCTAAAHLPVSQALQAAWAAGNTPTWYRRVLPYSWDILVENLSDPCECCYVLRYLVIYVVYATRQRGTGGCCPTAGRYWWKTCQTHVSGVTCYVMFVLNAHGDSSLVVL